MKSQAHNEGELSELKVSIEKDVVEKLNKMASNSGMNLETLTVIALKRFISSHSDYLGKETPPEEEA